MNRRNLLKGMMAVPVAGALGCHAEIKESDESKVPRKGTLRVVLNGAFAIVVQKNARNRLRVFSPRELSNLHEFYFNDPTQPMAKSQAHNFELLPDGLEASRRAPEVDGGLSALNVATDLWCQDEYFVTIDLPAPDRITFMPPLHRAVLASGAQIQVASNHVLEYRMVDPSRVRMVSQDSKDTAPSYFSDLVKRYGGACAQKGDARFKSECEQMKKRYESSFPGTAAGFFFGVGLAPGHDDHAHAVQFFNQRTLASFPHLAKRLELKSIEQSTGQQQKSEVEGAHVVSAVWQLNNSAPRVMQASYVLDCTIAGPIVTHPAGGGG
jgi:hypothetical protein